MTSPNDDIFKPQRGLQYSPSRKLRNSSCQICYQRNSNDMVTCDVCKEMYHFECANVTREIFEYPWNCSKCITSRQQNTDTPNVPLLQENKISVPSENIQQPYNGNVNDMKLLKGKSRSSRSSKRHMRELELKKLEEERVLQEKRDREFLTKKYQLLEQYLSTSEEELEDTDNANNVISSVSNWMKKNDDAIGAGRSQNIQNEPIHVVTSQFNQIMMRNNQYNDNSNNMPTKSVSIPKMDQIETQLKQNNLPMSHMPPQIATNHGQYELKPNHIAARHAISKDLPSFYGKYEEWPLFISAFENSTRTCNFSHDENLIRLQQALKGKALEAVRCKLLLPSNVPDIIATLRMLFGRPEVIIASLMQKVRKEPPPRVDKLETLIQFSLAVQNLCATMEVSGMMNYLYNPSLLQELSDKLPPQIKLDWAKYKQTVTEVSLSTFNTWLSQLAYAASDVTILSDCIQPVDIERSNDRRQSKTANVNTHIQESLIKTESGDSKSMKTRKNCIICSGRCMSMQYCEKFISLDINEKWSKVLENKLCRKCLKRHGKSACTLSRNVCGVNGCEFRHNKLLHHEKRKKDDNLVETEFEPQSNSVCDAHQSNFQSILYPIVPVTVMNQNTSINTFAFLDNGSSITLMENDLANELGLIGTPHPIYMKWTGDIHRKEESSRSISFKITGVGKQNKVYEIHSAHTVDELNLPIQTISPDELEQKYPHLKGLPINSYHKVQPRLIGLDNISLILPLKVKEGNSNQPVGAKTRLGWTIFGPSTIESSNEPPMEKSVTFHNFHICEREFKFDNKLNEMVKEFFSFENEGITKGDVLESTDGKIARNILQTTTVKNDNRVELAENVFKIHKNAGFHIRNWISNSKVTGVEKVTGPITRDEYIKSENMVYRQSQFNSYPDEVTTLQKSKYVVEKSSSLYKYCPKMDEFGVIRAHGRINAAEIPERNKYPSLLDANDHVMQLIVQCYHWCFHHHNQETVINELRQIYIIPRLQALLKEIRKACRKLLCLILRMVTLLLLKTYQGGVLR